MARGGEIITVYGRQSFPPLGDNPHHRILASLTIDSVVLDRVIEGKYGGSFTFILEKIRPWTRGDGSETTVNEVNRGLVPNEEGQLRFKAMIDAYHIR